MSRLFHRCYPLLLVMGFVSPHVTGQYRKKTGPSSSALSVSKLEKWIVRDKIQDLGKLIDLMPDDLKTNFVMMHNSKSVQKASYHKPRLILFSNDGNFTMAFNSEAKTLEILEFNRRAARYEAAEISFVKGTQAKVERHPASCIACHGSDLRPNWESYRFWEGSYGQHDDILSEDIGGFEELYRQDPGLILTHTSERKELAKFLSLTPDEPIYGKLKWQWRQKDLANRTTRPNLDFLNAAQSNNILRLARIIRSSPDYKNFKYLILASLGCGERADAPDPNDFFPDYIKIPKDYNFLFDPFGPAVDALRDTPRHFGSTPLKTAQKDNVDKSAIYPASKKPYINFFTYIFDQRGISTINWSMNFRNPNGVGQFNMGNNDYSAEMMNALIENDPDFKGIKFSSHDRNGSCFEWAQLSKKSLARLPREKIDMFNLPDRYPDLQLASAQLASTAELVQAKCVGCHDGNGEAPFIAFNWPSRFREQALKPLNSGYDMCKDIQKRLGAITSQQMPPKTIDLSDDERRQLKAYFDDICFNIHKDRAARGQPTSTKQVHSTDTQQD